MIAGAGALVFGLAILCLESATCFYFKCTLYMMTSFQFQLLFRILFPCHFSLDEGYAARVLMFYQKDLLSFMDQTFFLLLYFRQHYSLSTWR